MKHLSTPITHHKGFSLIEMAIVLFIVALLLGGLLPTVSSQIEQQKKTETRKQLDEIQQALIGYTVTYGRLPCPAIDTSNGIEKFDSTPGTAANGLCETYYNGFVPATTLGIATGVDIQGKKGFAVDGWGNRIRYAVSREDVGTSLRAFTSTDGMKAATLFSLASSTLNPLYVCESSSGITTTDCGTAITLTDKAPALIFSLGQNGAIIPPTGADEIKNTDDNKVFVSHGFTPTFDDLVVWISPNILINRMVSAGKLP